MDTEPEIVMEMWFVLLPLALITFLDYAIFRFCRDLRILVKII